MLKQRVVVALLCLVCVIAIFWGCREQPPSAVAPEVAGGKTDGPALAPPDPVTCTTSQCIRNWLDDTPCYGGGYRSDLIVKLDNSPYSTGSHHIVDECTPPQGGNEQNWIGIIGDSETNPAVIDVVGSPSYNGGQYHAALHIVENVDVSDHNLFQNIEFGLSNRMNSSTLPAIQFEAHSADFVNVTFNDGGTAHFLAPLELSMDGVTLAPGTEIVVGRNDWCGETPCAGPPAVIPADGAEIINSNLAGKVEFDVIHAGTGTNTMYVEDNDLVANLVLEADAVSGGTPAVELTDNVLGSAAGARVTIKGDYEVLASGNTTFKGPSYAEAKLDFDITEANSANALTLTSWVYDGVTYNTVITISNVQVSHNPVTCKKTITWTTNIASSSTVYYGSGCGALNQTATGAGNTTSHSVVVDVSGMSGTFAYRVESVSGTDRRITKCYPTSVGRCYQLP